MKKIFSIKWLYVLLILSVIVNVVAVYKIYNYRYTPQYFVEEAAEEIYESIDESMEFYNHREDSFAFMFRRTDSAEENSSMSYLLGVTNDKKMYVVFGYQRPNYKYPYENYWGDFFPCFAVTKNLNNFEFKEILSGAEAVALDYKNVDVSTISELNEPSREHMAEIYYDDEIYSYDLTVLTKDKQLNNEVISQNGASLDKCIYNFKVVDKYMENIKQKYCTMDSWYFN